MQSKEYWEKRMINTLLDAERSVLDYEKLLEQAYDLALIQIKKEIDSFFQKYARDNKIPYTEARRRLTDAEKKGYQTLLKEWYSLAQENGYPEDYRKYLQELGKKVYISRLETLESAIRHEVEKLKTNQYKWTTELLDVNYLASYYGDYFNVAQGLGVEVNFATVDKIGIERAIKQRWDGHNYSDSIWNDKDRLLKTLQTILPRSFSMGLNSRTLGDMIAKEMNTSKNRGRTLARTEVNHICNQSSLDVYKLCDIEEYEYLATLDMRTSEICRSLDGYRGKVTLARVGVNYPPMHPNCRSTTIPYFADDTTQDRIARDENGNNIKVPRRMTQEQWINKYVPEDQRERLLQFKKKYSRTDE